MKMTSYFVFLCLCDSRANNRYWIKKDWPTREALVPRQQNVINPPLVVSRDRINLPPLHIELGLKQFVKGLEKNRNYFLFFLKKGSKTHYRKDKIGHFDDP